MPLDTELASTETEVGASWRTIFGNPRPQPGDTLVHLDYGIGRFEGIEEIEVDGATLKTARLHFANEASLMVPEAEFGKLWTYGAGDDAPLDALDGDVWQDRLIEARREIASTAKALLARARERRAAEAPAIDAEPHGFDAVVDGFPHEMTEDQMRADRFVARDLAAGFPMDRLVIGDVGYGKTELVIRAAARVALSGHQVAVIVPTTILCRQVADALRERLGKVGLEIGELSRLVPDADRKATREALRDGSLRIVVGTSVLASRPACFSSLGLVIVDEEHRFGARAKTALADAIGPIHRLMLTATPIPQALTAAEIGLRDVSVLATAPKGRKPVRTEIATFSESAVSEAVASELDRGGQVFVVAPRIADMDCIAGILAADIPASRVATVHGKMKEAEIAEAIHRFRTGEADVLLGTSIVESGLDIPTANTMIVCMGGRLGLAQLHQLRGRVGRSDTQAFMLVLAREQAKKNEKTMERLEAFGEIDGLGAGFRIALLDRNRRGGGDVLGEAQTGHVSHVGTGLYRHILLSALREAA